jgi:hypothetical protein
MCHEESTSSTDDAPFDARVKRAADMRAFDYVWLPPIL